jgi:hypothetical protein
LPRVKWGEEEYEFVYDRKKKKNSPESGKRES